MTAEPLAKEWSLFLHQYKGLVLDGGPRALGARTSRLTGYCVEGNKTHSRNHGQVEAGILNFSQVWSEPAENQAPPPGRPGEGRGC